MKEKEIRKRHTFDKFLELAEKDVKKTFDFNAFIKIDCPACRSSDPVFEFEKKGFKFQSCRRCATVFVNPRPSLESLKGLYADSESAVFWVNEFYKPFVSVRKEKIFRPRAEYINRVCNEHNGWVIGDIGAGFGLFLEELKRLWPEEKYVAIEPSPEAAEICKNKGFDVHRAAMEEVVGCENHFNLLTAFEVLDHLFDPIESLSKVHALLKPGGYFLCTAVNGRGFDTMLLWKNSKMFTAPLHLNILNPQSLRILLERLGFDILEISTPGRIDWDIVEGTIREEGADLGRFWNFLAKSGTEASKQELQGWVTKNNLSSHMRVLARKKTDEK